MIFIKKFYRKRNFKLYLILLTLSFALISSLFIIFFGINQKIVDKRDNVINRELVLSTKNDYEIVKKEIALVENVEGVYRFVSPVKTKIVVNNLEYSLFIDSEASGIYPNVKIGNNLSNLDPDGIILPLNFVLENNLNIEKLLNNVVEISVGENEQIKLKFKVQGFYKCVENCVNVAYISYENMEHILYGKNGWSNSNDVYTVIVNKQKNVDAVIKKLKKIGYYSELYNNTAINETNLFLTIGKIILFMVVFIYSLTFLILFLIISNIIKDDKYDIAILKSIGFNNYKIFASILKQLLFLMLLSFVLSLNIVIFISVFVNNLLFKDLGSYFIINLFVYSNLLSLLNMIIIIVLCCLINIHKIKNISPVLMFKK